VFGRNRFDGYARERRQIEELANARLSSTRSELFDFSAADADKDFYRSLHRLARLPTVRGNAVELLIDGDATFDSIEAGCAAPATTFSSSSTYCATMVSDGGSAPYWRSVPAPACASTSSTTRSARAAFPRSWLYRELVRAGVRIAAFNTTQGRRNRLQLNFRNHRKVVVVDSRDAWIGGHNVGDRVSRSQSPKRAVARYARTPARPGGDRRRADLRHGLAVGDPRAAGNRLAPRTRGTG
jgi:cardiolipin synthase